MTTMEKLKAYRDSTEGLNPYAYLDADDAKRILRLEKYARKAFLHPTPAAMVNLGAMLLGMEEKA